MAAIAYISGIKREPRPQTVFAVYRVGDWRTVRFLHSAAFWVASFKDGVPVQYSTAELSIRIRHCQCD